CQVTRHLARLVVEPDQTQQLDAACVDTVSMQRTGALMHCVKHRNAQIVGEVQANKRTWKLEAARQSTMGTFMCGESVHCVSVEMHAALLVLQRPANAVDERTLAGAVRPDQPEPLALFYLKFNAIKRDKPAEALADIADMKERAHLFLRARRRSCTRPISPFGAMTTNATTSRPTISKFTAEEMVTVATYCSEPSRTAPTNGPPQRVIPPMIGIAIELTAYSRPNAEAGCRYPM